MGAAAGGKTRCFTTGRTLPSEHGAGARFQSSLVKPMSEPIVQPRRVGLYPVATAHSRILILGSMPSEVSLANARYYAHPSNRFWTLMGLLFPQYQSYFASADFNDRYEGLNQAGVALWDTIGSCIRVGSDDGAIRDAVPNNVAGFLTSHPKIGVVLLNGSKSADMWHRYLDESAKRVRPYLRVYALPSTSAANAVYTLSTLKSSWTMALEGYR